MQSQNQGIFGSSKTGKNPVRCYNGNIMNANEASQKLRKSFEIVVLHGCMNATESPPGGFVKSWPA